MVTQPSFYLAAVPAVILLGLSKGGFAGLGVLGMPLMALTIPPVQAAAITLPILIVQDAVSVWAYRQQLGPHQPEDPAAGCGRRHPPGLPARGTGAGRGGGAGPGLISIVFALRRFLGGRHDRGADARAAGSTGRRAGSGGRSPGSPA